MNQRMASLCGPPSTISSIIRPQVYGFRSKLCSSASSRFYFSSGVCRERRTVCCTSTSPWESASVTYAPTDGTSSDFLKGTADIFDALNAVGKAESEPANTIYQPFRYLKWPMWLIGPLLLLVTGVVPALWLPISSIFLGPNIASFLSLTGLDCIFNLGASLFLLMADSCARFSNAPIQSFVSRPPLSYKFWNVIFTVVGLIFPLTMFFVSHNGFLQPQIPFVSFLVLLGPYFLLLSVQLLTETLTWHWGSPVWLLTPVVYEGYRVLQLMRGLKLGGELGAPAWVVHGLRGLVCWWVLVLGVQLMRVAWFAGIAAREPEQEDSTGVGD